MVCAFFPICYSNSIQVEYNNNKSYTGGPYPPGDSLVALRRLLMIHWYYLAREVCRTKEPGPTNRGTDTQIVAFGSDRPNSSLDEQTKRIWLRAGLGEIAPLFAGGLAAALIESTAISWLTVGLGLLGTALVIAILWKKYPIPPPPIEATPKSLPKA